MHFTKEKFFFHHIWIYDLREIYFKAVDTYFFVISVDRLIISKNEIQLMSRVSMFVFHATQLSTVEHCFVFIINTFFSKDYMCTSFNCSLSLHVNSREICTLQIAFLNGTPFDTLKKNVMLPAINIIHKWSTVVFSLWFTKSFQKLYAIEHKVKYLRNKLRILNDIGFYTQYTTILGGVMWWSTA